MSTVIPIITTMAKAYTRGNGFDGNEPNDEVAAVIATASARLASNTKQISHRHRRRPVRQTYAAHSKAGPSSSNWCSTGTGCGRCRPGGGFGRQTCSGPEHGWLPGKGPPRRVIYPFGPERSLRQNHHRSPFAVAPPWPQFGHSYR